MTESLDALLSQLEMGSLGLSWGHAGLEWLQEGERPANPVPRMPGVCPPAREEIPALLSATASPCRSVSFHQLEEAGASAASQGAWEETGRRPDGLTGSEPRRIVEMDRRERCLPLLATVGNS